MSLYEYERSGNAQKLIGLLKRSDNAEVRRRAAEALGRLEDHDDRDDIINALVQVASENDTDGVVAAAIDALDEQGQDALEKLIATMANVDLDANAADWVKAKAFVRALDAEIPELRMAAANALGELDESDAVPQLTEAFDDSDPRVRARAARATGKITDPRATNPLESLLTDPKAGVRREAAEALGRISNRQALQALLSLYDDDDERVRRIAVSAFGNFDNDRPVDPLINALGDEAAAVRRTAVFSLIELLSNVPTEKSHQIRETVVEQLSDTDDATVVDPLVEILQESSQAAQRRNTAWLLGRVMDDQQNHDAIDALVDALADGGQMTQQFAATSLAEIGGNHVERKLLEIAEDSDAESNARGHAVFTLGKVGDEETGQRLEKLLDDTEDEQVRKKAFSALSKLGGHNASP
ncbi:HEAT repeat domain-containing protein [Salinibaculum rarum]|uniref:HEAT repeat domain-containing protein n=1 Tax=Salinibaculum rarum TaxID=3058903 RepID=UPI00265FC27C|nr:HEAT repeat domain-containing protein [Salinibaculum sp. KK48]